INEESLEKNARLLESVLQDFGVKGQIVKVRPGPVVTLYELEPAPGTKTSRVVGLADDVARSMSAVSVRIAVVPGHSVIGIELRKAIVALKWTVREMEGRYRKMSQLGVRNIEGYNQRVEQAASKGETLTRKVQTGFDPETGAPIYEEQPFDLSALPFVVVIVDEMADLMLIVGK